MQLFTFGDPETVLRGHIYTNYFYGRSGYGKTPEIDELEHAIFLALETLISIPARAPRYEGDFDSIGCADVRSVQLSAAFFPAMIGPKSGPISPGGGLYS